MTASLFTSGVLTVPYTLMRIRIIRDEIAPEFGEKVRPSADTASPNQCAGHHWVGPEPDPTSARLAIMRDVRGLEAESERDRLDTEKKAFGPSGTR